MHGNLPAQAQRAIFPPDTCGDEFSAGKIAATSGAECVGWFAELAQKLWGRKAWASISLLTKAKERTAQRWAADDGEPGATVLRDLIRSDDGAGVLDALLIGCKSKWVRDYRRGQIALAQLDQWKQLDLGIE
jgi:hypothetical protein